MGSIYQDCNIANDVAQQVVLDTLTRTVFYIHLLSYEEAMSLRFNC